MPDLTRLPELVRTKADAMGETGRAWLASLPDTVRVLEKRWSMTAGAVMPGGSEALVLSARRDGREAVLKIGLPQHHGLRHEAQLLALAGGRGYAELFERDEALNAILVERLGRPLADCGLSHTAQIEALCETAQRAWIQVDSNPGFMTGAAKARWLQDFIIAASQQDPGRISSRLAEQAQAFARVREAAWSPAGSRIVHGDVHAFNTLEDLHERGRYRFIDPDGYFMEPAYDLGLIMRDFHAELRRGDPLAEGKARCRRLADATGIDADAIWQWGLVERVTTGLYLWQLGEVEEAREFLGIAELWVE